MNSVVSVPTAFPNHQRVRKAVGTDTTEFIVLGTQLLAEKHGSDWTDLIYVGGRLLTRATSFQDRVHISATTTGSTQYALGAFPNGGGLSGYVIQSGDVLHFRQSNAVANGHGGIQITFTDATNTNWTAKDQNNVNLNDFNGAAGSSFYRKSDLSGFAGKSINNIRLVQES